MIYSSGRGCVGRLKNITNKYAKTRIDPVRSTITNNLIKKRKKAVEIMSVHFSVGSSSIFSTTLTRARAFSGRQRVLV